ncbi:MAG: condensation domain-containing protein, partial [Bacteroidota bacterium]
FSSTATENEFAIYLTNCIQQAFDLSQDYLLRAHLLEVDNTGYILVLVQHHIVSDGWSTGILSRELTVLYQTMKAGQTPDLPPLPLQYIDYTLWQRKYWTKQRMDKALDWWENQLAGVTNLQLPTDYARPAIQSHRGATFGFTISQEQQIAIQQLANEAGASLYMTLLAVFHILMYRYSGQKDFCVGTPLANRDHEALEPIVGLLLNTLVLRNSLEANWSFRTFLNKVKGNTLAAYAHQDVPFEMIVDRVLKDRSQSRSPLFQVMFTLQNIPELPHLDLGTSQLSQQAWQTTDRVVKFDLTFTANETPNGLTVGIEYCRDLFSADRIERMAQRFCQLIKAVTDRPELPIGQLSMLNEAEQLQLLQTFNSTRIPLPIGATILDQWEQQVQANTTQPALFFGNEFLTYQQLDQRANQLGHFLQTRSIGPGSIIGLALQPSPDLLIAILGILKTGATYLPIDVASPEERIRFVLKDSDTQLIVTDSDYDFIQSIDHFRMDENQSALDQYSEARLDQPIAVDSIAYILYTSGSTGLPKGVMIEHRSLLNYFLDARRRYVPEG